MQRKKGKKVISVDFTGVEAGGGGKLLPEGPIQLEIEEITEEVGQDSGVPYLAITFAVAEEGDYKGTKAWDNFSLSPQSLWKLRGLLDAGGIETVDGPMDIDPDELVGTIVVGDVIHEEYKGKQKHRINGYSAVDGEAAEESTPAPTARRKPAGSAKTATFKVKEQVAFMDGKKRLVGVITKINGDVADVKVGKEEYEVGFSDLEAA